MRGKEVCYIDESLCNLEDVELAEKIAQTLSPLLAGPDVEPG